MQLRDTPTNFEVDNQERDRGNLPVVLPRNYFARVGVAGGPLSHQDSDGTHLSRAWLDAHDDSKISDTAICNFFFDPMNIVMPH